MHPFHALARTRSDVVWPRRGRLGAFGLGLTVALHAGLAGLLLPGWLGQGVTPRAAPTRPPPVLMIKVRPPEPLRRLPPPSPALTRPPPRPDLPAWEPQRPVAAPPTAQPPVRAIQAAPPAPTAEEWAFAGSYTLKNSKAYRHTWGQQVRSMMGTAVEGPDQGMVRFRVEIAPDGQLASLETLWSTSAVAERLARQAIAAMPRWPATPTGQPLIFEKTIAFSPFAHDDRPLYRDDCQPDPPVFSNPFAWNGQAEPGQKAYAGATKLDPQALADCLKQLPRDSIDAEIARGQRMMEQWGWNSASAPSR